MQYIVKFIIIVFFLLGLKFFSFIGLDPSIYGNTMKVSVLLLIGFLVVFWSKIRVYKECYASFKYVLAFCLWPLITAVSCYIENGQTIPASLNAGLMHSVLAIYFLCVLFDIDSKFIIKLIITLALIRTGLTIIQQFTYPDVWFSMRTGVWDTIHNEISQETRSGIYRFLIGDAYYLPMFMGFYSFDKILKGEYGKYIWLMLFACIGLYLDQTRQVLASFVAALCFVPLLSSGSKYRYAVIIFSIAIVFFFNFDILFSDLMEQTTDEVDDSNIRLFAYAYYWENTGSIITTLFGNGFSGVSNYGSKILDLQEAGLWRVDIGIVGVIHLMGFLFVAVFLFYYWDVIKRYWNSLDMYIQFMYISIFFQLPLILPLYNTSLPGYECFMALLFYLTDCSFLENEDVCELSEEYGIIDEEE